MSKLRFYTNKLLMHLLQRKMSWNGCSLHIKMGLESVASRHLRCRLRLCRLRSSCVTVYHKDRFSARSYFYCIPLTSQLSTSMLTTLKYMDLVHRCSTDQLQSSISACIDDVAGWMASYRLQLNASKTEIIWCSSVYTSSESATHFTGPCV